MWEIEKTYDKIEHGNKSCIVALDISNFQAIKFRASALITHIKISLNQREKIDIIR